MAKPSILFVCRANICRSPMAEGIALHWLKERGLHRKCVVESAGTHAIKGGKPDPRAQKVCAEQGVELKRLRSRPINEKDFQRFDCILAMDPEVLADLQKKAPVEHYGQILLVTDIDGGCHESGRQVGVPDPYFGSVQGFYRVYELLEDVVVKLLEDVQRQSL